MKSLIQWTGIYPATVIAVSLGLATMSIYEKRSMAQDLESAKAEQSRVLDESATASPAADLQANLWDAQQASAPLIVRLP